LDALINFYEFLKLPGINKKVKRFTEKKSRAEAADLSQAGPIRRPAPGMAGQSGKPPSDPDRTA
jgi:hypothetical protein